LDNNYNGQNNNQPGQQQPYNSYQPAPKQPIGGYPPYQGQPGVPLGTPGKPESNVQSILSLVFGGILFFTCYFSIIGIPAIVLGIISLVNASKANDFRMKGNIEWADFHALKAKKLGKIGFWIAISGLILLVIAIIVFAIVIAVSYRSSNYYY